VYHPENQRRADVELLPKEWRQSKRILLQQNSGTATHFLMG
jgi:hypothetical protein